MQSNKVLIFFGIIFVMFLMVVFFTRMHTIKDVQPSALEAPVVLEKPKEAPADLLRDTEQKLEAELKALRENQISELNNQKNLQEALQQNVQQLQAKLQESQKIQAGLKVENSKLLQQVGQEAQLAQAQLQHLQRAHDTLKAQCQAQIEQVEQQMKTHQAVVATKQWQQLQQQVLMVTKILSEAQSKLGETRQLQQVQLKTLIAQQALKEAQIRLQEAQLAQNTLNGENAKQQNQELQATLQELQKSQNSSTEGGMDLSKQFQQKGMVLEQALYEVQLKLQQAQELLKTPQPTE